MFVLIIGGSASGKSAFAEEVSQKLGGRKLYAATMQPFDAECERRIARHREMRREKAFETWEIYRGLQTAEIPGKYDTILLECLSNLLANEMYGPEGWQKGDLVSRILDGMQRLWDAAPNLVVVSNEVFQDGDRYHPETLQYMEFLGEINRRLAAKADLVAEVVCGVPIFHKGEWK
ncbi:MAG: bifunctional adenosylcobinamide kinase/adenosylcobinamide-phosphate guanylyltransferase [Candidatus Merdivicinus sp.]|jgi:adenosylcobinamide kinase/adenosylcobinamide-phosphate guanylyltransferase